MYFNISLLYNVVVYYYMHISFIYILQLHTYTHVRHCFLIKYVCNVRKIEVYRIYIYTYIRMYKHKRRYTKFPGPTNVTDIIEYFLLFNNICKLINIVVRIEYYFLLILSSKNCSIIIVYHHQIY